MLSIYEMQRREQNKCPLGATSDPCKSSKNFPCDCLGCVAADKLFLDTKKESEEIEVSNA